MCAICSSSSRYVAASVGQVRLRMNTLQVFYSSMMDMLEPKAKAVIFANVEDLLLMNTVPCFLIYWLNWSDGFPDIPELTRRPPTQLPSVHRPHRRYSRREHA
jgi:hypothetical protein